ncbi:HAD family hydrolase [Brachyspira hyodysenteriae]|uniref:HAD family hydrolase n=1 Tax=Brachyspira hyodysenteriae TaxID=159 RepID=UPI0022CD991D|nr:HAD-IIB family hydrolase [Brachyspira hyodysenteriae]MCZ9837961.1 HAD family hydrolase [Brachyspira hyodysenteriae]MCZ9849079.1 HAD family hydrolase [Brachyspira hyodysenteriae]MCZ9849924.1 HAD family hydrolase [Brachyspira hyodysenteriae]MCZ9861253.1 HAD family hydrolase [Brachyspira hyodysenteriae]MCZ9871314.1 HAD family hydrolase [Brachyspira hyodysenteriae]
MKLFFSDYDMTIYIHEKIDDSVFDAIKKWREAGNIFTIATGRNKFSIFEHIDRHGLEFDYLIANNGALVFNNKREIIFKDTIDDEVSYKVIRFLHEKFGGTVEIANDNYVVSVKSKEGNDNLPFKVDKKININEIENLKNIIQINKMTPNAESTEIVANTINEKFKEEVTAYANIRTVDIVKNTVNKANGVDFVHKFIERNNKNIIDKILVAGDSNNDIEMIKKYNGYAQINANEKIKSITNKYFNFISDIIYKEL